MPAGNHGSCIHQNKYAVQEDEYNQDSLQTCPICYFVNCTLSLAFHNLEAEFVSINRHVVRRLTYERVPRPNASRSPNSSVSCSAARFVRRIFYVLSGPEPVRKLSEVRPPEYYTCY